MRSIFDNPFPGPDILGHQVEPISRRTQLPQATPKIPQPINHVQWRISSVKPLSSSEDLKCSFPINTLGLPTSNDAPSLRFDRDRNSHCTNFLFDAHLQSRPSGNADRGRMALSKSVPSDAVIDVGRFDQRVTIAATGIPSMLVGEDEKGIGGFILNKPMPKPSFTTRRKGSPEVLSKTDVSRYRK